MDHALRRYQWAADAGTALAVDPDANVYLTGRSGPAILTLKYDANGRQLWQRHYQGALGGDFPIGIALDSSQTVYVAGTSPRDLGFGEDVLWTPVVGQGARDFFQARRVECS